MTSNEIRQKYLDFFAARGHKIIPSASLVPENDPTVLFNTAGMQPLVPYLMGNPHPQGDRLVDIQKCLRTNDIDEVGDNTHLTFFEMMGNWSLGSYFKEDAIKWSYELLTSKTEGFGLDLNRLYITVFAGDDTTPRDLEAAKIWEDAGIPKNRIYFKGAEANWWPAVKGKDTWTGPTGPCSEMFYDITENGLGDLSPVEFDKADDEQKVVEIWNDVFMEFEKKDGTIISKLEKKNVDTGAGFERVVAVLQGKSNVFDTDLFKPVLDLIESHSSNYDSRSARIVADHIRASVFLIADGVVPSNNDQGYILRRLIRRAFRHWNMKLEVKNNSLSVLVDTIISNFKGPYPETLKKAEFIKEEIKKEEQKFARTLSDGISEYRKLVLNDARELNGDIAFKLFTSYGVPLELSIEIAKDENVNINPNTEETFNSLMSGHQDLSRSGSEKKFKGGLADTSDMSVRYHTATHLLNAALRQVLGTHVMQKGSNITPERMRFDFSHPEKLTAEQLTAVEDLVNQKVSEGLPVTFAELPIEEAEKTGAVHAFGEKYGSVVKVYSVGDESTGVFSREFCGGPHVRNTKELGHFKIAKEEAVSAGVRRIKAVLE